MVRGFSMYGHKGLELAERTHVMFALVTVSAACNVALNLIFVPLYGYTAAAVTTVAGYLLYPVLVHRATRRHVPWLIPWREIMVSAGAGVVALAAGAVVRRAAGDLHPVLVIAATGLATLGAYAALVSAWLRWQRGREAAVP